MKTKSLVVIAALVALTGIAQAEEGKKKGNGPNPEVLAKYDTDQDGKLSKEERAAMKKDKPAKVKKEKKSKNPTAEQLANYDTDKDGQLNKEELAAMKKDKPAKVKKEKKPKVEEEEVAPEN